MPIYSHMPAVPHFSSGMSSAHHSGAANHHQMHMFPVWEILKQQQEFQRQQQDFQRQQLEFQRQQQEMYKDHNGLMQNMVKNFDMVFKSIMGLVNKVTGTGHAQEAPPQPHHYAHHNFSAPYQGEEKGIFEPTAANDPIKVQVDPNSRKIVRISTN